MISTKAIYLQPNLIASDHVFQVWVMSFDL